MNRTACRFTRNLVPFTFATVIRLVATGDFSTS